MPEEEDTDQILARIEAVLKRKRISKVAFGEALNAFLPKRLRSPITPARRVTIYRWFSDKHNHRNPNADTVLALKRFLKANDT